MKKILITGASGFIGSFLVEAALERSWEVWAGIRKSSSREYLQDSRIQFIDLNFSDPTKLQAQITEHAAQHGKWDYVIHNAGITKSINVSDFDKVNYLNTKHLIEALHHTGNTPEKFILMSSLSAHHPQVHTAYGDSKRKAEAFVQSQANFPHIVLAPTGVYGPREKDYYLMLKTVQSGLDVTAGFTPQKLTFVYVTDLAQAAMRALESPLTNKTYLISDGKTYSDAEYSRLAKKALGKKHVIRLCVPLFLLKIISTLCEIFGKWTHQATTLNRDKYEIMKQRDWSCNICPIAGDLKFEPQYDLERGLTECVAWYRENNWL
ncbi:NAD-dependent dehydratase [Bacteroidia bacterium]|nr:NAD-dependent dehydratase [Bacteroidia bacterium]